mgnify:CR=1 FL=1
MDSNHKSKKYTKVLNEYAGIGRINLRERKFIAIIREYIRRKFYFFNRRVQDMNDLEMYREQLALCDDKIIDALVERNSIIEKIMAYKEEYGMPILQPQQEEKQKAFEEAQKAQDAKLKEQEEKLKAEKDKYGFNEKTTLKSAKVKGKKVTLKWKKNSKATGYEIYRATKKNGKYKKIRTIKKASAATFTDSKVKKGKTYYYKVRAYKTVKGNKANGKFSAVRKVKIKK